MKIKLSKLPTFLVVCVIMITTVLTSLTACSPANSGDKGYFNLSQEQLATAINAVGDVINVVDRSALSAEPATVKEVRAKKVAPGDEEISDSQSDNLVNGGVQAMSEYMHAPLTLSDYGFENADQLNAYFDAEIAKVRKEISDLVEGDIEDPEIQMQIRELHNKEEELRRYKMGYAERLGKSAEDLYNNYDGCLNFLSGDTEMQMYYNPLVYAVAQKDFVPKKWLVSDISDYADGYYGDELRIKIDYDKDYIYASMLMHAETDELVGERGAFVKIHYDFETGNYSVAIADPVIVKYNDDRPMIFYNCKYFETVMIWGKPQSSFYYTEDETGTDVTVTIVDDVTKTVSESNEYDVLVGDGTFDKEVYLNKATQYVYEQFSKAAYLDLVADMDEKLEGDYVKNYFSALQFMLYAPDVYENALSTINMYSKLDTLPDCSIKTYLLSIKDEVITNVREVALTLRLAPINWVFYDKQMDAYELLNSAYEDKTNFEFTLTHTTRDVVTGGEYTWTTTSSYISYFLTFNHAEGAWTVTDFDSLYKDAEHTIRFTEEDFKTLDLNNGDLHLYELC